MNFFVLQKICSYFKFRSGIFPVDIEADGVNFRSIDSTNSDQLNKIEQSTLETNRYTTYDDKFQIYLFIGIIFMLIELSISERRSEYWEQFKLFKND